MNFFYNSVVFLRHGETERNVKEIIQGQTNSSLTERGILQAEEAAERLKGHSFDIIISSPIGRALETAKIISSRINVPISTDPLLAERNFGAMEGKTFKECQEQFPSFWNNDKRFIHQLTPPQGESFLEFINRAKKALEGLREISKTKKILAVSHGAFLSAMISQVKGIDLDDVPKLYQAENCQSIILS